MRQPLWLKARTEVPKSSIWAAFKKLQMVAHKLATFIIYIEVSREHEHDSNTGPKGKMYIPHNVMVNNV